MHSFNPLSLKTVLAGMFVILCLQLNAEAYKRIYVHSDADEDYIAQRSPDRPESYYFYEGIHFASYINDRSLRDTPFREIVEGMAPNLAKQDYWPAKNKETCDLLLVVSWGTTNPEYYGDVSNRIFYDIYDGDYYDNIAAGDYDESDYTWYGKQRNSKLLGFYPYIRRDKFNGISRHDEYELRSAMLEERYFIIVTAFDFQELINNQTWKRVWSTRFNVRSPGINFRNAHIALSKAAAPYYGKKLDKLGTENADSETIIAEIEIGDIEILETIDAPKGEGILNALRIPDERR